MQMKAFIKKQAKIKRVDPRLLIQAYVLDDLLERISLSAYRDNFVLKGGFLIASMIGVDARSTKDLDATIIGLPLTQERMIQVFTEICVVKPDDDPIALRPVSIKEIRDEDEYGGFRIGFKAKIYQSIEPEIKIDVSTGDVITPHEIKYQHHLLTEDRSIIVMAYNLETSLAEKLEACISNGVANTRAKDYYDIYTLTQLEWQNIDFKQLKAALKNTSKHRGSEEVVANYAEIIDQTFQSETTKTSWSKYQRDKKYAQDITLDDVFASVKKVMTELQKS
jgi:predicted nucleotidyltransferase component of viral defense system